nr:replication initiator [Streptomyces aidingensis]
MRHLPDTERDIIRLASDPRFTRWLEQVTATGACTHPIHLAGSTTVHDRATGEVLHHYDTTGEPGERLLIRCRNRRASICPTCSRLHAGDTYHLVRAGLTGGRNVPGTVRDHPRLFVTLTAPSFGPVHRSTDGQPCRPRRGGARCGHGRPLACREQHAPQEPRVGQPLCPDCYDYPGHVLWHAHTGRLWKAITDNLYNHLAARTGRTRGGVRRAVRISFAKIAEYQKRAAIHLHAVLRVDGGEGPGKRPPPWADAATLASAVRSSTAAVRLAIPYTPALGERELCWGTQLDIRPLRAFGDDESLTDDAVAAYVAKYVTKGADETGAGLDRRIRQPEDIATARVSAHVRALMGTCWRLGGLRELGALNLRAWAHTLGFRGHILTKSRVYSTTYAALREERAEHQRGEDGGPVPAGLDAETVSAWRYVGSGHSPGGAALAAGIAADLDRNREEVREIRGGPW